MAKKLHNCLCKLQQYTSILLVFVLSISILNWFLILNQKAKRLQINKMEHIQNKTIIDTSSQMESRLPFSHLPKQPMIPMDELLAAEGIIKHNCKFKGKVFNLGLSKTGTTTMKWILNNKLKYKCSKTPMNSCRYYGLEHYYKGNGHLPLYASADDISWILHSKALYNEMIETVKKATVFTDEPWPFLYPIYDQIVPREHSKFILSLRDSTRDVINSNMKMYVRKWKRFYGQSVKFDDKYADQQFNYKNFSILTRNESRFGVKVRWKQFWILQARLYEMHTQNVIDYFTKRDRLDDLLIINLRKEAEKTSYSEQWFAITNFLGCPNISDEGLPSRNNANDDQIDFFPKNYTIDWHHAPLPQQLSSILDVVQLMKGTFDAQLWHKLKHLYGEIYAEKH